MTQNTLNENSVNNREHKIYSQKVEKEPSKIKNKSISKSLNKEQIEKKFEKYFKTPKTLDFTKFSTEFLNLKKIDIRKKKDEYHDLKNNSELSSVKFSHEFSFIPKLKTLIKVRREKPWAKNKPKKSILKSESKKESINPISKDLNQSLIKKKKKNLKKLIKRTIQSNNLLFYIRIFNF